MTASGSLADVLAIAAHTLSPALIDPPHLDSIGRVCARLPRQFAVFWGLECSLGTSRAAADVLVELKRDSRRHHLLAGLTPSLLDPLCGQVPAWAALRAFARQWHDEADARRDLVRNLWIEFDVIAASQAEPPIDALARPSVFWGPHAIGRDHWTQFLALTEYLRESFAPFPGALPLDRLERAVAALPAGAQVFQLGAMQLRGDVMLRMCVNKLAPSQMVDWLERQQWPGDCGRLRHALDALTPLATVAALDVDYTAAGIGPKIGIECYRDWAKLEASEWQGLLDAVTAQGLCLESKRDALLAYPAKTEYSLRDQLDRAEDGHLNPVVYRNIHHVKLAFVEAAFREAKAYLGVTRPGIKIGYPFGTLPEGDADEWLSR